MECSGPRPHTVSLLELASTAASLSLVHHVVPARLQGLPLPNVSDAFALWSRGHDRAPPEEEEQHLQRA